MTLEEKLAKALTLNHWVEQPSLSRKLRTFTKEGVEDKVFIGHKGALRRGRTSTASYSITDSPVYKRLLRCAEENTQIEVHPQN